MIHAILELLKHVPYEQGTEAIKFAKGKYQTPHGFKGMWDYVKERVADGRR